MFTLNVKFCLPCTKHAQYATAVSYEYTYTTIMLTMMIMSMVNVDLYSCIAHKRKTSNDDYVTADNYMFHLFFPLNFILFNSPAYLKRQRRLVLFTFREIEPHLRSSQLSLLCRIPGRYTAADLSMFSTFGRTG